MIIYSPTFSGSTLLSGSLVVSGSLIVVSESSKVFDVFGGNLSTNDTKNIEFGTRQFFDSTGNNLVLEYSTINSAQFFGTSSYSTTSRTSSYYLENDPVFISKSSSLATTSSNIFIGNQTISGSFIVFTGSAVGFQVTNIGTIIGNTLTDIHSITGSLRISGSITGSLLGTSSWATNSLTASYALTSAGGSGTGDTTSIEAQFWFLI